MANSVRQFSTTCITYKQYFARQGRMINKIMHGAAQKKKYYKNPDVVILPSPKSLNTTGRGQSGITSSRRVAVLNKLFMKHVTDLMATGEASSDIIGRGIEISRVKVSPDFTRVNVFWLAKGTDRDDSVERILAESAPNIRHELSQLRIMGQVPLIEFIKDKQYAKISEVDARLAVADFGDDFEPTDQSTRLKSEFSLNLNLPNEVKNAIKDLEAGEQYEVNIIDDPLPPMRMDVLGLNHAEILNMVQKSVKQSKAAWENSENNYSSYIENQKGITTSDLDETTSAFIASSSKDQKLMFTKFLQKQQILKMKIGKKEKYSNQTDQELLWMEPYDKMDNDNNFDKDMDDYIEDFDDDDNTKNKL